jgi:Flp pilus assembly protein TadG
MSAETTATVTAKVPRRRSKERGAAAIELALSLLVLLPLVLGMLDYGYYFYVSMAATEATRLAARATGNTAVGDCTNNIPKGAAIAAGQNAARTYLTTIGMGTSANLTTTILCQAGAPSPQWSVQVQVDFRPAVGFLSSSMKASTRTTGWVVFSKTLITVGS